MQTIPNHTWYLMTQRLLASYEAHLPEVRSQCEAFGESVEEQDLRIAEIHRECARLRELIQRYEQETLGTPDRS